MGVGHLGLRKIIKKETEYIEKKNKYKYEFDVNCLLKGKNCFNILKF